MSNKILVKRGNTPPTSSDLQKGEPGFDKKQKKFYVGLEDANPFEIGEEYIDYDELKFDKTRIVDNDFEVEE